MFWGAEGVGASWPGGEASLPVIVAVLLLVAVLMSRRAGAGVQSRSEEKGPATDPASPRMGATRAGRWLLGVWEFFVAEDWRTAVGAVLALTLTGVLATAIGPAWWIMPVAVIGLLARSVREVSHGASLTQSAHSRRGA
jgi:uncharacterized membrane protein